MRKSSIAFVIFILALLPACSPVKANLVGRWEYFSNEDHSAGVVYEFMEENVCLYYEFNSSQELLYPALSKQNVLRYDYKSGSLITGQWRWHGYDTWEYAGTVVATGTQLGEETRYALTFLSDDELQLVMEGETAGRTFQRADLLEMPFKARLLLGENLQETDLVVTSVERLQGDWQTVFPGYVEVNRSHFREVDDSEQWAVVLQQAGSSNPVIFILVNGESWWGLIRLEKAE